MECVCGCGRSVPKGLVDRNFLAARVALELLVWDKNRALPGAGPEGREGLIARGADCYARLLYSLHGEGADDPDEACEEWVAESARLRAGRSDLTKKKLLGIGTPNVTPEDMDRMDRAHPELSFTGSLATAPGAATGRAAASSSTDSGDDPEAKLERLRALRDDAVLSAEEFAAAEARLLGHD